MAKSTAKAKPNVAGPRSRAPSLSPEAKAAVTTGDVAAADAPDAGADGVAICAHCGTRRTPNLIDAIDYVQCSVEGDLGCGSRFLRGPDGLVFDPAHPRVMPDSEQEGLSPLLARIRGTGPAPPVE